MTGPLDDWTGFSNISAESEKYGLIKHVLFSANFEHMKQRAINSRRDQQIDLPIDVDCDINLTKFATGFCNLVIKIAFSDNVCWVARIPYRAIDDNTKTSMLSEIATMKIIRQRTNIPVARIFDFDMSMANPFGFPYTLMECLEGHKLGGVARSIPQEHHAKAAKQFANVFAELQNLTFNRIGRLWCGETADEPIKIIPMAWHHSPGPLETSLEYFYNQRHGDNRKIMALYPDNPDQLTTCWVLKTTLPYIIIEDRVRGPFPLCHLDLHAGNLLFDDEYNLTGVIDWSNAQAAPLEQLSVSPELSIFPGRSEEYNRLIVEFKELVIQFLKEMETEKVKEETNEEESSSPELKKETQQSQRLTPLSTCMASVNAELMHRQYMATPRGSLFAGKRSAHLIYGERITWEQLREVYGRMPFL